MSVVDSEKIKNEEDLAWTETARPVDMRRHFREGKLFKKPTCGMCKGFTQANLTMLHKSIAGNFGEFCEANQGPLCKIFQSEVGQFSAPAISQEDSDIRTDLQAYVVYEDGIKTGIVNDLLSYGDKMNDFVFFYFGCSFSFDLALLKSGVPLRCLEQNCNVSAYRTNIRCHAVGKFDCPQVVSMRPIPKHRIETAFKVTHPMGDVHGAPVHIGNPDVIGITDITKPEYCDPNIFHEGDIAVFWSCGITGVEAIRSAKPHLAFTHCPGHMYISDTPLDLIEHSEIELLDPSNIPKVISLAEEPYLASVTSEAVVKKIKILEELVFEDPGQRQIDALLVPGDLLKSALSLSHSSSVLITTGFPCLYQESQPYEVDGIAGAIAIATIMQALGKTVTISVGAGFHGLLKGITDSLLQKEMIQHPIPVLHYPPSSVKASKESAMEFLTLGDGVTPGYDHLVAIECTGQSADGKHYTMKGVDVSHLVDSADYLFAAAAKLPLVYTTGIGDGGNEIGMGKVYNEVVRTIPQGDTIACTTSTDYLITSGISDWGGYALAAALYLLKTCPIHDRYQRRAVGFPPTEKEKVLFRKALPTVERERKQLELFQKHGLKDWAGSDMTVDSLPFDGVLDSKIKEIIGVSLGPV